jgi:hypothetical protein
MSLMQRVERAQQMERVQQGEGIPDESALVPVQPPPPPPSPSRVVARAELLGDLRFRLQNEIIGAFDATLQGMVMPAGRRAMQA